VKNIVFIFLVIGSVFSVVALFVFQKSALVSAVFAYTSSSLIMFASFYGFYKKSQNIDPMLYMDDDEENEDEDIKKDGEVLREDGAKDEKKRFSFKNFTLGNSLFFSVYRLFAYGFFILGFFMILRRGFFDVFGFVSGVLVSTLAVTAVFLYAFIESKRGGCLQIESEQT